MIGAAGSSLLHGAGRRHAQLLGGRAERNPLRGVLQRRRTGARRARRPRHVHAAQKSTPLNRTVHSATFRKMGRELAIGLKDRRQHCVRLGSPISERLRLASDMLNGIWKAEPAVVPGQGDRATGRLPVTTDAQPARSGALLLEVARMLRPRTAAVASLLLLPMVAGGFLLQKRAGACHAPAVRSGALDRGEPYVDSLQGSDIFEKAAHGARARAQRPVQRAARAEAERGVQPQHVGGRYGGVGMLLEEQKTPASRASSSHASSRTRRPKRAACSEGDRIMQVDTLVDGGRRRSTRCPMRCAASPARR